MSNATLPEIFLRPGAPSQPLGRRWSAPLRERACRQLFEELESRELLSDTPTHLVIGVAPTNGYIGLKNAVDLTVEVTDASGDVVAGNNSVVKLSIGGGPAGALHGSTAVRAVNGVATFTDLVFSKGGTFTLSAADGPLTGATTGSITIIAAPVPTSLEFTSQPQPNATGAVAGGPVVVEVLDQYGNAFAGTEQISLSLSSAPAKGKVGGTLSARTVAGSATFNVVTVNEGGTFALKAKLGKLTAVSDPFDMGGPPVATSLDFVLGPTASTAGQKMTLPMAVEVLDQYGNILTTDHSTVALKLQGGPAHSPVFTAPVKLGVAVFSKVVYDTAGTFTLAASDGKLPAIASGSFTVAAGAATHLVFATIPANKSPAAGPLTVVVDADDKFGNVDTTSTVTVSLVLASAPHGSGSGSTDAVAAEGVATFDALVFPLAGRYVLKATASGLVGALSQAFILA